MGNEKDRSPAKTSAALRTATSSGTRSAYNKIVAPGASTDPAMARIRAETMVSVRQPRCGFRQSGLDRRSVRQAALGHVFTAASAAGEFCHHLLHERAHIKGLSGGLREYQRRLRRSAAQ